MYDIRGMGLTNNILNGFLPNLFNEVNELLIKDNKKKVFSSF